MTITLCNSHPFTFYLPFHTSLRADQCPIQSHVPSTCTLGLDPCARHSLFGRTDPYYIDNFYSSCGLKRLAATLASPFSVIVLSSQYLFQRGPIWVVYFYGNALSCMYFCIRCRTSRHVQTEQRRIVFQLFHFVEYTTRDFSMSLCNRVIASSHCFIVPLNPRHFQFLSANNYTNHA